MSLAPDTSKSQACWLEPTYEVGFLSPARYSGRLHIEHDAQTSNTMMWVQKIMTNKTHPPKAFGAASMRWQDLREDQHQDELMSSLAASAAELC